MPGRRLPMTSRSDDGSRYSFPMPRRGHPDLPATWHLTAIEHVADAILVADLDGTVRFINAAFEHDSGFDRDTVLGSHLRRFAAPKRTTISTRALWDTVRRGETWTGDLVSRRADGSLAHVDATLSPIRNDGGIVIGGVAVWHDITGQQALQTRLDEHRQEREALAAALGAMRSGETAEETAAAIAHALRELATFNGIGLFEFRPSGDVVPLAGVDAAGADIVLPGPLPAERSAYLRERAGRGPWIEEWDPGPKHPYRGAAQTLGVRVIAYVPIRSDGDAVGLLVVGAADPDTLALAERLPALVDGAAFAGALLGPQLRARSVGELSQKRIRTIIEQRAFLPVFQPIVDLATRVVVGYEGLTRFVDGSPPDQIFAEAARCGLAIRLEAATLEAILDASATLPSSTWLNLNVSPELVLASEPLASILRRWGGQIVLELTEHAEVTDYPALRAALDELGPAVRLAVDDAGAGFASLRHILELQPDYVKLDRWIVRQIHRDPARQALVAGMVHFAGKTGAILVAEGIETDPEAYEIQRLGVTLAQGYRLGRPAPASGTAAVAKRASPVLGVTVRSPKRRAAVRAGKGDIREALNIGPTVASALRDIGIANVTELRTLGAMAAWERLRQVRPRIATARTLQQLEGAARGVRIGELPAHDRERLRLFATHGRGHA
jgi:PAS domain S-box-containing protein